MSGDGERIPVPLGRGIGNVLTVLGLVLLLSLAGLIALGAVGGDAGVRGTLTHIAETVLGMFVGLAAGRLAGTGRAAA